MNDLFEKPTVWLLIYIVMVFGRAPIREMLKLIGGFAETIKGESHKVSPAVKDGNARLFKALKQMFDIVLEMLNSAVEVLDQAVLQVSKQFTSQREMLPSQILGAVFSFVLLLAFIYADAALAFQAIQTLFPGVIVPEMLRDIGVALVASSVATIAALGMMFWDAAGFTHLTPLSQLKGLAKGSFIGVVVLTSSFTLACTLLIALNRAPILAELVRLAGFDPAVRGEIHRWASLAQSLVIAPVLVTTFMMFRGVFGLFVLYMVFLSAVSIFLKLTRMLVRMIKVLMVPGVSDAFASGFLFAVSEIILMCLGWIIGIGLALAATTTQLLQLLLDVVTLPPVKVLDWIIPIIKSLLIRPTRPNHEYKSPFADEIPEVLERNRKGVQDNH
jgi:hypothetical protein